MQYFCNIIYINIYYNKFEYLKLYKKIGIFSNFWITRSTIETSIFVLALDYIKIKQYILIVINLYYHS